MHKKFKLLEVHPRPAPILARVKDSTKVKGEHIITVCDMRSGRAKTLEQLLENVRIKRQKLFELGKNTEKALHELWLEYHWYLEQLHKRFLVRQFCIKNITTTVGRTVFARRLSGNTLYTGIVNYGALGTNAAAPAVGNTQLGTETYRKALSSGTFSNNIAYLENFYTAAEVNGTFEEYGFFIDGNAGANTGQLFNRFTTTVIKSNTESLNVQSTVTFNDA